MHSFTEMPLYDNPVTLRLILRERISSSICDTKCLCFSRYCGIEFFGEKDIGEGY